MGDRVSIQFVNGAEKSVVLFSHWGGMEFVERTRNYVKDLVATSKLEGSMMPLYRLEPDTVMVDFISAITEGKRVESDLYLGATEHDGDNSDNGHYAIDLS